MINFKDKVCWITGASSGIGKSLAISLSNLGSRLILSARNTPNLERVREECMDPDKVKILPCDLEETDRLPEVSRQAWDIYQGIDFAFLNAGFAVRDKAMDIGIELYEQSMKVNFLSSVIISKTLLPLMIEKGKGTFVVTSSLSGKYGIPKLSAYSASKHALHGYFESLRAEYAHEGIHINMIVPGLVKTNITINSLTGDGKKYDKMQEAIINGISPEKCAKGIIRAVEKGKNEAVIGGPEVYSVLVKRLFPGFFTNAIRNHPLKKLRKLGLRL